MVGLNDSASIFSQYLNLRKEGDEYLKSPDPAKIKLFKLFVPKLEKQVEEEKDEDTRHKLKGQLVFFKHELFRDLADYESLFKNITENLPAFEFSEHIDTLAELIDKDEVWSAHHASITDLFFKILDDQLKDTTIANYNMQRRFFQAYALRLDSAQLQQAVDTLKEFKLDSISNLIAAFTSCQSNNFILKYMMTLSMYLQRFVVEKKDKFRSKNYLILTLDIFKLLKDRVGASIDEAFGSVIRDFIATATNYYKNTLTLADELQHLYLKDAFLREIVLQEMQKVLDAAPEDKNLQCTLRYQHMLVGLTSTDLYTAPESTCIEHLNRFLAAFDEFEHKFYNDVKKIEVEKGDRIVNDNYLYAACEILRVACLD